MTQITLTVEKHEGDQVSFTKVKHEITKMKLIQFTKTLNHVKDIMQELSKEGELSAMVSDLAGGTSPIYDAEGMNQEQVEELVKKADMDFIMKGIGAFGEIVQTMPEHGISLLSTLSGIEKEILENQEIEVVLDIVDAVIEVNDLELLIKRIKKSFGQTIGKLKFLQVRKEATQA